TAAIPWNRFPGCCAKPRSPLPHGTCRRGFSRDRVGAAPTARPGRKSIAAKAPADGDGHHAAPRPDSAGRDKPGPTKKLPASAANDGPAPTVGPGLPRPTGVGTTPRPGLTPLAGINPAPQKSYQPRQRTTGRPHKGTCPHSTARRRTVPVGGASAATGWALHDGAACTKSIAAKAPPTKAVGNARQHPLEAANRSNFTKILQPTAGRRALLNRPASISHTPGRIKLPTC